MRLEHYPLEKLKREILGVAAKYLDLRQYKIFFFGSRVTGRGSDRSDIDVGILGPRRVDGHVMVQMQNDLEELRILYLIDPVDFFSVSPDFKSQAVQEIEYLTEAA